MSEKKPPPGSKSPGQSAGKTENQRPQAALGSHPDAAVSPRKFTKISPPAEKRKPGRPANDAGEGGRAGQPAQRLPAFQPAASVSGTPSPSPKPGPGKEAPIASQGAPTGARGLLLAASAINATAAYPITLTPPI